MADRRRRGVVVTQQGLGVGERIEQVGVVRIGRDSGLQFIKERSHERGGAIALTEDDEGLGILQGRIIVVEIGVGALLVAKLHVSPGITDVMVIPVELHRNDLGVRLLGGRQPGEQGLHLLPLAASEKRHMGQSGGRVEGVGLQFQQLPRHVCRLRKLPQVQQCVVAVPQDERVAGVEGLGATVVAHGFRPKALLIRQPAEGDDGLNVARGQRQGFFQKLAGAGQIVVRDRGERLHEDDRRIIRGQPDGLGERRFPLKELVAIPAQAAGPVGIEIHAGDFQPGRHEIGVPLDRGLQQPVKIGPRRARDPRPEPDLAGLQVVVVGIDARRGPAGDDGFLLWGDGGLERPGDLRGQLRLDGEDVADLAVEGLGPDMLIGAGADELAGHPHLVSGAAYAALKHIGDAQLRGDLPDGLRGVAILHDRGARHDAQL